MLTRTTLFAVLSLLLLPIYVYAQEFVPISDIPNTTFDVDNPDNYFQSLFNIFIVVAIILAVIRLMICGIQLMTSESIPARGNAKTCIQYVLGGLLLALASFILLQTINSDLVGGSFADITSEINVDLQDLQPITPGAEDGQREPQPYQLSVRNECSGNVVTFGEASLLACEQTLASVLGLPRWTIADNQSCSVPDGTGQYWYAVRESGNRCSRDVEYAYFDRGSWFQFDETPCEEALEVRLQERNYTLVQGCTNIEPPGAGIPGQNPPGAGNNETIYVLEYYIISDRRTETQTFTDRAQCQVEWNLFIGDINIQVFRGCIPQSR